MFACLSIHSSCADKSKVYMPRCCAALVRHFTQQYGQESHHVLLVSVGVMSCFTRDNACSPLVLLLVKLPAMGSLLLSLLSRHAVQAQHPHSCKQAVTCALVGACCNHFNSLQVTPQLHNVNQVNSGTLPALQNVSEEAQKAAGSIADAAPQIADKVSNRISKEADQVAREAKPAAEKAAKRISSEADQLGKEARPMADKASDNIEARAREAGEAARPAADNASEAMKKTADDASGQLYPGDWY